MVVKGLGSPGRGEFPDGVHCGPNPFTYLWVRARRSPDDDTTAWVYLNYLFNGPPRWPTIGALVSPSGFALRVRSQGSLSGFALRAYSELERWEKRVFLNRL